MEFPKDIKEAIKSLMSGGFTLVHDEKDREDEVDFIMAAQHVKPLHIRTMRKDGGGLICVTMHPMHWKKFGMRRLVDLFADVCERDRLIASLLPQNLPYDTKSSFSITINHRGTYTGITDRDRALTISQVAEVAKKAESMRQEDAILLFAENFRSPGHVPLLLADEGLLGTRRGHTEYATVLLKWANLTPCAAICEMMGDDGNALSVEDAIRYARRNGVPYIEGTQILEVWEKWSE